MSTWEGWAVGPGRAATARRLISSRSLDHLDDVLRQVVSSAVQTVPGADAAGISLATTDTIESRAPFNDAIRQLDKLQVQQGQGPCLRALTYPPPGGVVVVDDLLGADAGRWPLFAAQAQLRGYRSMCRSRCCSTEPSTRRTSGPRSVAAI